MRGDAIVVVDGHCRVPNDQYLNNVATAFRESGAECLGRPQPLGDEQPTAFQQAVSVARSSRLGHNPDSDIYSSDPKFVEPQSTAIAYKREVFERVGLFDERFDACEDVEFNTRVHAAGFRCWFDPKLAIVYHPRSSWRGLFKQLARYGAGRAKLAAKHPNSITPPALVPPLWIAWLALGGLLSLAVPAFAWLYFASIVLYALAIVGGSLALARAQSPRVAVRLPGVFLGIHFGFGWGFLREAVLLNGRHRGKSSASNSSSREGFRESVYST
jgi:succinoglycan biosynthesis protein ExoA